MKNRLIRLAMACISIAFFGCEENGLSLSVNQAPGVRQLQPKAAAVVRSGLESTDAVIRTHAIEVVATTQNREMAPYLLKCTKDSSVMVRFAAIVAIGDMQCVGYENTIGTLLTDANANVRMAAAYTLAKLNQPNQTETIRVNALSSDQTVRANALLLLGKLGSRQDLPLLYDVMQMKDSTEKVRMQAVESIARLRDNDIYRTKLWALLISAYLDDRIIGIRGMGALGTDEAVNAILTMLDDEAPEVRLAAAAELARLGNPAGTPQVLTYFQAAPTLNKANLANTMAISAIGFLKSDTLNGYLPEMLNSPDNVIRMLAARSVLLQAK